MICVADVNGRCVLKEPSCVMAPVLAPLFWCLDEVGVES